MTKSTISPTCEAHSADAADDVGGRPGAAAAAALRVNPQVRSKAPAALGLVAAEAAGDLREGGGKNHLGLFHSGDDSLAGVEAHRQPGVHGPLVREHGHLVLLRTISILNGARHAMCLKIYVGYTQNSCFQHLA